MKNLANAGNLNSNGKCLAYSFLWGAYHVDNSTNCTSLEEISILEDLQKIKADDAGLLDAIYGETKRENINDGQKIFSGEYQCRARFVDECATSNSSIGDQLNSLLSPVENKPGAYVLAFFYQKLTTLQFSGHAIGIYNSGSKLLLFDPNVGVGLCEDESEPLTYVAELLAKQNKSANFLRLWRVEPV